MEDELKIVLIDEVQQGTAPTRPIPSIGPAGAGPGAPLPVYPAGSAATAPATATPSPQTGKDDDEDDGSKARKKLEQQAVRMEQERVRKIETLASGGGAIGKGEAAVRGAAGLEGGAGAASAGMALAKLAGPVGIAVAALVGLGVAAKSLVDSFLERARELQGYSQDIAAAQAQSEVRSMMMDIQEAQELGPALSSMVKAQSDLDATFRELMLPIKKFVAEVLASLMNRMVNGVDELQSLLAGGNEAVKVVGDAIVQAISLEWTKAGETLESLPDRVAKAMADALKKKEDPAGLMDQILKMSEATGVMTTPDPQYSDSQMRLNIPAFSGAGAIFR